MSEWKALSLHKLLEKGLLWKSSSCLVLIRHARNENFKSSKPSQGVHLKQYRILGEGKHEKIWTLRICYMQCLPIQNFLV